MESIIGHVRLDTHNKEKRSLEFTTLFDHVDGPSHDVAKSKGFKEVDG